MSRAQILAILLLALPLGWLLRSALVPGKSRASLSASGDLVTLEVEGSALSLTRPAEAAEFALAFYDSPSDPHPSGQRLASASLDGKALPPTSFPLRLPKRFKLNLELERASDFNLIFRSARGEGAAFVVRPRHHDLAWAPFTPAGFGQLRDLGPLRPLRAGREAALLLSEFLILAGLAGAFALAAALLARGGASLPPGPELSRRLPAWTAPAAAFLLSALIAHAGFERLPHVSDEIAAVFQARLYQSGALSAPLPPEGPAFRADQMLMDSGGWRAKYAPLWPATLALGGFLGAEWLVMPLALALAVWLLGIWAREADPDSARWAPWALALSPWALVMGGSYFNHALATAAALLFLWGVWRAEERGGTGWLPALGVGGLAALRPFTALCLLGAAGIWLAGGPSRWKRARLFLVCGAAAATAILASNFWMTGHPLLSPYTLYDPGDRPGFGPGLGSLWTWGSPGHDPAKALANTRIYVHDLATRWSGWPWALSLSPLLLAPLFRRTRLDSLLWLGLLSLVGGHFFYWSGNLLTHGAFYWFEAAPLMAWLGMRGLEGLGGSLGPRGRAASFGLAAVLGAWGLLFFLPPQVAALRGFAQVDGSLRGVLTSLAPLSPALVLVEDRNALDFHEAAALQEGKLKGPWVFARARGAEADRFTAAAFPGRRVLYWDGRVLRGWKSGKVVTSMESAKLGFTAKERPASQF